MSAATVITGGFGSFGDVAHVVTAGYDIKAVPVPISKYFRRPSETDTNYRRQFKGSKPT